MFEKLWPELWRQGPAAAILAAIVAGNLYGVWVPGSSYQELRGERDKVRTERDQFRDIALEGIRQMERRAVWRRQRAEEARTWPARMEALQSAKELENAGQNLKKRVEAVEGPTP